MECRGWSSKQILLSILAKNQPGYCVNQSTLHFLLWVPELAYQTCHLHLDATIETLEQVVLLPLNCLYESWLLGISGCVLHISIHPHDWLYLHQSNYRVAGTRFCPLCLSPYVDHEQCKDIYMYFSAVPGMMQGQGIFNFKCRST